jgi:DNA-binding CsgD family transcriptional regulator
MLLDRVAERAALSRLLEAARAGQSGVLVVRGEPGIGKTELVEAVVAAVAGMRIVRAAGVESEMELPYAALQQLCAQMLDRLERLPGPQRDALAVAFGLRAGDAPERFLVGLATLSLVAEAAAERPLLCVIDDAQWLDRASAQALAFVARRLLAEPVALVVTTREPDGEDGEFSRLPELLLGGLDDGDARELLGSVITGPVDKRVLDRFVAETRGNPLALLELPRALTAAQLTGGFGEAGAAGVAGVAGVPELAGLAGRIEDSFRRRLEALPAPAGRLLVVAAAEPAGDPALLWRAAGRLGIAVDAAAAAEEAGLVAIGDRVIFRHPLVRSAVYRAASPEERRAAHQALADATDPRADPDRRAWHRAQAAPAPDEEVAAELEASAGRAQARGGMAAAGTFLQRSAALTLDPARRSERALAAARAKYQAGAFDAALGLVAIAEAGPLDEIQRARTCQLRGQIAFASSHGSDAPSLLLKAARRFGPMDKGAARDTYLEALLATLFAGRLASGDGGVQEIAEAARAAVPSPEPAAPPDLLLDGLALLITEGYPAGAPVLKRAVSAFLDADVPAEDKRYLWLASHAARLVWDYESWAALSARMIRAAREIGALIALHIAFGMRASQHLFAGEFADAASIVAEVDAVSEATGGGIAPYAALTLAAFRGRESEVGELIEASTKDIQRRGEGGGLSYAHWASAVLYNGLGRYEQALAAAQQVSDLPAHPSAIWGQVELVEAATRSGVPERAAVALRRVSDATRASGSDWALGIEARSRALVTDGEDAENCYREAIDHLGRTRLRIDLGRAHLLYGEWLRREQRRRDAREQLGRAHEIFDSAGAAAFAKRTRIELRASGGHARRRTAGTREPLTAQEATIARLAGAGASNQQIATQLFISPATVAYHLRKVFPKLGISSRGELAGLIPAQPGTASPAAPHR